MKRYCVVYIIDTFHYRFRCYAKTKKDARKECNKGIGVRYKDMVDVYED